ncbi:MAG: ATP-dependent Clp protease ATP-binding subunit, partial [Clostridia bacterium]|nr:ATP-dependent Clp protease ATP-binding subunit [Clostridia bacterium]
KRALEDFLRPEFINRVDEIITFNSLTQENFVGIAALMLSDLCGALAKKGINATFTDAAAGFVAEKSYSAKYGARNMRRFIQTEIEDKVAEKLIAARGVLDYVEIDAENGDIVLK